MSNYFPMVPLGELLAKSEEWIDIKPDEYYRQVTVKLWGKGVVRRDEVNGADIAADRRLVVKSKQFILSRIDARNGAFGLIPESLDGAVVSSDFPVYTLNRSRIQPEFLSWMSKTRDFIDLCKTASEGSTNRIRLKEEQFLATQISLPPLEEQQRTVARIEELAGKIEEARGLRREAVQEVQAIVHSIFRRILTSETDNPDWEVGPIPLFAEVNPSRHGQIIYSPNLPVSFVPMAAVDDETGSITKPETRAYEDVSKGHTMFQDGDVIFARITPCMQNGKAAFAEGLTNGVGFGSTEFHVLRPGTKIMGQWLHLLVRHKDFRDDAVLHFKGTAGQQRVPKSFFEQKVVHVPPLSEQQCIISYIKDMQAKINVLKQLQAETSAELDALLPSILDKAFKGEL